MPNQLLNTHQQINRKKWTKIHEQEFHKRGNKYV